LLCHRITGCAGIAGITQRTEGLQSRIEDCHRALRQVFFFHLCATGILVPRHKERIRLDPLSGCIDCLFADDAQDVVATGGVLDDVGDVADGGREDFGFVGGLNLSGGEEIDLELRRFAVDADEVFVGDLLRRHPSEQRLADFACFRQRQFAGVLDRPALGKLEGRLLVDRVEQQDMELGFF